MAIYISTHNKENEEFIQYWLGKDDDEIVSFLYDVDLDGLKTVIDIDNSIDNDETTNIYEVIDVDYLQGKRRIDLIALMRSFIKNQQ